MAADAGEADFDTGIAELADAERISRSYVCRVLRLTLLAPDLVERILDGRPTAGLAKFLKPLPWCGSAAAGPPLTDGAGERIGHRILASSHLICLAYGKESWSNAAVDSRQSDSSGAFVRTSQHRRSG